MKLCKDCNDEPRAWGGSYCKTCKLRRRREWAVANPERLRQLERSSKESRRETIRANSRAWYSRNADVVKDLARRWASDNPLRRRMAGNAKSIVRRAILSGTLTRPTECAWCAASGVAIEGAHSDYSKPLQVVWLCRSCHRTWDRRDPKTAAYA